MANDKLGRLLESLTTVDIIGQVPKEVRAQLVEDNRANNPLYAVLPRTGTRTNIWYWNKRIGLPTGGPTTQAPAAIGTRAVQASSSRYLNNQNVTIRSMTFKGDVGKIAEEVATVNGSVIENEMRGQAEAEARTETVLNLYGCEGATINSDVVMGPHWNSFYNQMYQGNIINYAGAAIDTNLLDGLYDSVRTKVGADSLSGRWLFIMSPQMQSRLNRQFNASNRTDLPIMTVKPQLDPGIFGEKDRQFYFEAIKAMAGVELYSYRGCPIVSTSFMSPVGQMGAVTAGAGAVTGTSFTAAPQYYRVEAVTLQGKTVASAEVSYTPVAGGSVALSWATPLVADYLGNTYPVLLYRIFRGQAAGTATLYAQVSSCDNNGNPILSYTDTNAANDPRAGAAQNPYALAFATQDGLTSPATGGNVEDLLFVPMDGQITTMAVLNELKQQMLAAVSSRSAQFETTADMALAVFSGGFIASASNVTR